MSNFKFIFAIGSLFAMLAALTPINSASRACFAGLFLLLFFGSCQWHVQGKRGHWTREKVRALIIATFLFSPSLLGMGVIYLFDRSPPAGVAVTVWLAPPVIVIALCHPLTRHLPTDREGICAHCGYSLQGLSEDRCPECGTSFT